MPHTIASIGWPVLDRIRIGDSFAISPHGLGIAIGFLSGAWLLTKIGPRRGLSIEHINSMVFWALIGTIIGSRFFYVLAHLSEFDNVGEMLAIWRGGISLLGGIAGATLINVHRMRRYGYRFFQVMDPAVVCLALGIGIGRVGDLIIGDHLGKPTSWLLAWTYKGGTLAPPFSCAKDVCQADLQLDHVERITRAGAQLFDASGVIASGVGVHQTALYDMAGAWLLFGFLWWLSRTARREGVLTLTFGLWYGCMRLIEDSLRIDKRFFGLTGSQWTALTVAVVSAALLIAWAVTKDRDRGSGDDEPGDDERAEPPADEPGSKEARAQEPETEQPEAEPA